MSTRYALYAAPRPGSPLWDFGSRTIGYDAATGQKITSIPPENLTPELWARLTEEPRRYGFHATLKAPFRLAEGQTETLLCEAVQNLLFRSFFWSAFALKCTEIGSFLALVPDLNEMEYQKLRDIVAEIVRSLEPFRAPLNDAEMQKRLKAPLTERQRHQLENYGYPYIFNDFRFHLTLTGEIADPALRAKVLAALSARFAPLADTKFEFDSICLFRQLDSQSSFTLLQRFTRQNPS